MQRDRDSSRATRAALLELPICRFLLRIDLRIGTALLVFRISPALHFIADLGVSVSSRGLGTISRIVSVVTGEIEASRSASPKSMQDAPEALGDIFALQRLAQDFPNPDCARPLVQ